MTTYQSALEHVRTVKDKLGGTWNAIRAEDAARMIVQNRFRTGLDIANLVHFLTNLCMKKPLFLH